MSLFIKQDFTPPILSRRWIAIKCRPNMLVGSDRHVVSVLQSGLLFREDSASVEQAAPGAGAARAAAGAGCGGWLTRGERWLSLAAVAACVAAAPPTLSLSRRGACVRLCAYAGCALAVRAGHRLLARGALVALLEMLRAYTALARRTMACVKEYRLVHRGLECTSAAQDAALALLWRQQSSLAVLMSRCSSALLGNLPWLHEDVGWDSVAVVQHVRESIDESELVKIHHAFLVIQSTLLKHIAMAHFVQPLHSRKVYLHHNERIYWLHTDLLPHLHEEVKESYEALDRMYRLLKNYGANDLSNKTVKSSGITMDSNWLYSDVHGGIARATMELKLALNKCTSLDVFLDSCALNNQPLDVEVLSNDLDSLIDELTVCLTSVQNSQVKLRKIQSKFNPNKVQYDLKPVNEDVSEEKAGILKIEDKDPESKDEVFFFIKTEEEDRGVEPSVDVTTAPGKKEREATKIVLGELKRKLVKREDVMRHREQIALEKTMPELKGNLPEFPRQMHVEEICHVIKGYINKINSIHKSYIRNKLSKPLKKSNRKIGDKLIKRFHSCDFRIRTCNASLLINPYLTIIQKKMLPNIKISTLKACSKKLITISVYNKRMVITNWVNKSIKSIKTDFDSSGMSEGLSDIENQSINDVVHEALNKRIEYSQGIAMNATNESKYESLSDIENNSIDDVIHEALNKRIEHSSLALNVTNERINEGFIREDSNLSQSSSESDFDFYKERKEQLSLLKDIRRHRVVRKKNHPGRRSISIEKEVQSENDIVDEGSRPIEYSFGTGMALASVFQSQNGVKLPTLGQEEVFIGDGEVSGDSGNDEDS